MDEPFSEPISTFVSWQARPMAGPGDLVGLTDGWIAPVGFFNASNGFGEKNWVSEIPLTTLAARLSGATPIRRCSGKAVVSPLSGAAPALQPRGSHNHFACDGPIHFAQIYLPDHLLDRVADAIRPGKTISANLRDDLVFTPDQQLSRLCLSYIRAASPGHDSSALEMEARAILLVDHLVGRNHGLKARQEPRGKLAPWQVARTIEQIDAIAGSDQRKPSLEALASAVGLSPAHFCRAFAQSTGQPPHRWLILRRVERAKGLLLESDLSVAEIAAKEGFDDPSYFARLFRREVGATPSAYRRERRR